MEGKDNFLYKMEIIVLIAGFMIASASFLYVPSSQYSSSSVNAANVCEKAFIRNQIGASSEENCYNIIKDEHTYYIGKVNKAFKLVMSFGITLILFVLFILLLQVQTKKEEVAKDLLIALFLMSLCLTGIGYAIFHFLF